MAQPCGFKHTTTLFRVVSTPTTLSQNRRKNMKIKLFYQKHNESLDDFEYRVNQFTLSVSVIDIKLSEATYGNYEDMSTTTSLLVLYR